MQSEQTRVQWIGGATMLLREGPFRILTDPVFGTGPAAFVMRGHPSTGAEYAEIARLAPLPPLDLEGLDLLLLSHLHSDHFDAVAAGRLDKGLLAVAPSAQAETLRQRGFTSVRGLDWWQEMTLERDGERLRVLAVPARHSADDAVNADLGVVNGYVIERRAADGQTQTLYWTGDTVWFDGMEEIARRVGRPHLLLPHLGAVGTGGPWGRMTLNAEEARRLVLLFLPEAVIPIHHHTFAHYVEPVSAFAAALRDTPFAARLALLAEGDTWVAQGGVPVA